MDDPLRVLRCVRFASRFGFDLVPELQEAAKDADIQLALQTKISRERVGEELDKMMKGNNSLLAIQLIHDLGLYPSIFHIPTQVAPKLSSPPGPSALGFAAASILYKLTASQPPDLLSLHPILLSAATHEPSTHPRLYLACALTPYRSITYEDAKGKTHLAVEAAIREGTKLGVQNHYLDGVPALFAAANLLQSPKIGGERERLNMGLLMREKSVHNANTGSFWATSLLFSLVQELVPLFNVELEKFDVIEATKLIETYNAFVTRAEELDLLEAVDARPLLNGGDIVRVLEKDRTGPWTGKLLALVVEWQLEHPTGSKEECEQWLRSENAAGKIVFDTPSAAKPVQGKRARGGAAPKESKKSKT